MNVSAWSIRNPIPAVLGFAMLAFLGLMAFKAMKIQLFPDVDLPMVTVSCTLPGASPDTMAARLWMTSGRSAIRRAAVSGAVRSSVICCEPGKSGGATTSARIRS